MGLIKWLKVFILILTIITTIYIYTFIQKIPELLNLVYTIIILLLSYILTLIVEEFIKKQDYDQLRKYTLRKTISIILSILTIGVIFAIWFKETTTLVVAYGLLSAGVAIALQDLLKNIAGGIIIYLNAPFKAGDRIETGNVSGDVIDIKFFYTSIMEIKEWVNGDQYSGRIVQIPNSFVLNTTIKNYTKDFSFIWDEIHLMITYNSNLKKAQEIALKITHEVTSPFEDNAKNELVHLGDKYLISSTDVEEKIYTTITDNWIDLHLRYVVDPKKRRLIKNILNEKILEAYTQEKDIQIASATFEIVGFPKIKLEK